MVKYIPPVVKWSGSKRTKAKFLSSLFPDKFNMYFEPFVGGGSMLPYKTGHRAYVSDILPEIISVWIMLQSNPMFMAEHYRENWEILQNEPNHYYIVRNRFNEFRHPEDFLFLTRTCYNGLIRFNKAGEFNASHHFNRPGIHPDKLRKIIWEWFRNYLKDTAFISQDYEEIFAVVRKGDFVFLDPPYVGTKGQYQVGAASFDFVRFSKFLEALNEEGIFWLLTLGANDDTIDLPTGTYSVESMAESSSFARLKNIDNRIKDVVYANYDLGEKQCLKKELTE